MDADVATLRNNFLSPPNLLNPVSERNFWDRLAMTTPVKLSYFKKQRSGQLCPILLPLFSSTFHESDKLHDREKKFERRQRRRHSKLGGLEAFSPRKFSIEGLGNAISRVFRRSFSVNKCEEKCASSIFFYPSLERGEFYISHDALLHTMSSFRTHVILSVGQQWKATCFAYKTSCTFAVATSVRFLFYYSKYIFC